MLDNLHCECDLIMWTFFQLYICCYHNWNKNVFFPLILNVSLTSFSPTHVYVAQVQLDSSRDESKFDNKAAGGFFSGS